MGGCPFGLVKTSPVGCPTAVGRRAGIFVGKYPEPVRSVYATYFGGAAVADAAALSGLHARRTLRAALRPLACSVNRLNKVLTELLDPPSPTPRLIWVMAFAQFCGWPAFCSSGVNKDVGLAPLSPAWLLVVTR